PAGSASDQQCFSDTMQAPTGVTMPSCGSGNSPWRNIETLAAEPAGTTLSPASVEQRIAREIVRQRDYCYNVEQRPNRLPAICPNHRDGQYFTQCENATAQCNDNSFCRHESSAI